jgi:hypothetical protein
MPYRSPYRRRPSSDLAADPEFLKGRAAGLLGIPGDIINLFGRDLPAAMTQDMPADRPSLIGGPYQAGPPIKRDNTPLPPFSERTGTSENIAKLLGADPNSLKTQAGILAGLNPAQLLKAAPLLATKLSKGSGLLDETKDIMFLHNTSPEKLQRYNQMGGIPSPSIAVTRKDVPFEGFGEITLVGKPDNFNPRKTPVYSSDAYTPRAPNPFRVARKDAWKDFENNYQGISKEFNQSYGDAVHSLANQTYKKTASSYKNSELNRVFEGNLGRIKFLRENGVNIKPVNKKPRNLEIREYNFRDNRPFIGLFDVKTGKKLHSAPRDRLINGEDASVWFKNFKAKQELGGIDGLKTHQKIQKEMDKFSTSDFDRWVSNERNQYLKADEYFDAGGSYDNPKIKDFDLNNIVNYMKRQPQVGGEFGMGSKGIGRLKAALTGRFKNMDEIKANKSQIYDKKESKELFEKTQNEFFKISENIYDGLPNAKDFNQFGFIDIVSDNIFDAINRGATKDAIRDSFKVFKISDKQVNNIHKFIQNLEKTPVNYFEAKPKRAVNLDEFGGAIVPQNTNKETLNLLQDSGLKIKKFDPDVPETKMKARDEFEDLMSNLLGPSKPPMRSLLA